MLEIAVQSAVETAGTQCLCLVQVVHLARSQLYIAVDTDIEPGFGNYLGPDRQLRRKWPLTAELRHHVQRAALDNLTDTVGLIGGELIQIGVWPVED